MNWSETWRLAVEALRANKLRAVLTMLGVVIGSACIVLVVTVALTGKKYITAQIEAVGSNIVYASLAQSSDSENITLADQISLSDLEAVKQSIPQVIHAAGTNDISMTVVAGGKAWPVGLVGVTPGFQQIRNLVILRGRYFDDADFSSASKVCVVSEHLAQTVFSDENPIGRSIHVGELTFTVIGVFRERVGTFGQSEIRTDTVLVPFSLIKYYTGDAFIVTLYAQADRPDDVALVTQEVTEILRSHHRPEAEYDVQNLTSILETSRRISLAMTVVLLLIALMALLISGIGIMNIMLVSVTERTREIGIRKALGARQTEILYQFLLEAILISGVGALAGITVAVVIPLFVETLVRFLPVPGGVTIPISWISVLSAFVVSCATGVLFGYLPAKTAAQLQPVESLRYE
ncbi:MAG TPA: ABC transporter permease [Candidatus Polarisedimenticolia bacterium]|nr:ABC transporter permease [Candidatus Polarisedimenticolia bacterium]